MSAGRWPLIAGVVAAHLLAFWWLSDKHYLPKTARVVAPRPANFAVGQRTLAVDPATGQRGTETDFVVSTQLQASPTPARPK